MQIVNCFNCTKPVKISPSRLKAKFITCSIKCASEYKIKTNTTKIRSICPICGKEVRVKKCHEKRYNKQKKTCSRACRNKYLESVYLGENNPNFNHHPNQIHKYFYQKLLDLGSRARQNQLEINITKDDLIEQFEKQDKKCYYSKLEMKLKSEDFRTYGQADLDVLSIDRIDSNKGYIKDNIIICCNSINKMKGNSDYNTFKDFWNKIAKKEIKE